MKQFLKVLSLILLIGFSAPLFSQTNGPDQTKAGAVAVSFTLRNTSAQSIPLNIPRVMNPNLSPFSNSGVSLKVGQKIFFYHKGKKQLLLSVTEELEGKVLNVPALIREKKQALKKKKG